MRLTNGSIGIVSEVDAEKCLAKVTFEEDGYVTDWLKIELLNGFYSIPDINQQVAVWTDEDENVGVIMGLFVNPGETPPYNDKNIVGFKIPGVEIRINKETYEVFVSATEVIIEADNVTMNTEKLILSGNLELDGDISAKGAIEAMGVLSSKTDVQAGPAGIKFLTHLHASAAPGSPTGPPLPV